MSSTCEVSYFSKIFHFKSFLGYNFILYVLLNMNSFSTFAGYKIAQIENMGATLDQFDTIDLSDNDIRRLDGFPHLIRLKCLLLNNNRIVYV